MPGRGWDDHWRSSTEKSGQYSNFGPLWHAAAEQLSLITGRIALPCSSGTSAIAVAAALADTICWDDCVVDPRYEAFTFAATSLAAKQVNAFYRPIRTDAAVPDASSVIRTVPFGMQREFSAHKQDVLIIDAAGAFGIDALQRYPECAIITCSFHATKNFPIGEGGCVFLPAGWERQAKLARAAMNFGMNEERKFERSLCWAGNAKLDELHCALLLAQLEGADYFAARSVRIAEDSKILASTITGASLPYSTGKWQSMVVVEHPFPDALCSRLIAGGFMARRMYHPFVDPELLSYEESHLVALPSDMVQEELEQLVECANVGPL